MILGCRKRLIISTSLLNLEGLNRSLSRKGRKSTTYRIVRNHCDTISRYTAAIVSECRADNLITSEIHKEQSNTQTVCNLLVEVTHLDSVKDPARLILALIHSAETSPSYLTQ